MELAPPPTPTLLGSTTSCSELPRWSASCVCVVIYLDQRRTQHGHRRPASRWIRHALRVLSQGALRRPPCGFCVAIPGACGHEVYTLDSGHGKQPDYPDEEESRNSRLLTSSAQTNGCVTCCVTWRVNRCCVDRTQNCIVALSEGTTVEVSSA